MTKDKIGGRKAPRTKTGCWTCRERKVRCDETKPICTNCTRLGLECAGYGARITFRDDTPRVVQRMELVTDVNGCSVYDDPALSGQTEVAQARLRYKTYTPSYFEKHKDIELDSDLLEEPPRADKSPIYSPDSVTSSNYSAKSPSQHYPQFNGHHQYNHVPQPPSAPPRQWSPLPSPQRSPMESSMPVYNFSVAAHSPFPSPSIYSQLDPFNNGNTLRTAVAHSKSDAQGYNGPPFATSKPSIVINTMSDESQQTRLPSNFDNIPTSVQSLGGLTSPALSTPIQSSFNPYSAQAASMNLLVPPMTFSSRPRRSTVTSDTSDHRLQPSPSSIKWAEHFGAGNGVSTASSVFDPEDCTDENTQLEAWPRSLLDFIQTLEPHSNDPKDTEAYLNHYFSKLTGQLSYPDRGPNNPFRILVSNLCPREPALLHAVLAFTATDIAQNDPAADAAKAFSHADEHYRAAVDLLHAQITNVRHEQSTAALTTAYFLDLTNIKNVRPMAHTATLLRIVKARSIAGRIYEGGICWTWFNAVLEVCGALFGGSVDLMPYLIESEQLPTPGQGNMFPFIKKSEQERIEHSIISPMYLSQMQNWVVLSRLSVLAANHCKDFENPEFLAVLASMQAEMAVNWSHRAKMIDDLTKENVEEVFRTKWRIGIPIAQQIVVQYNLCILYIELLHRGSYKHEQLRTSVLVILKVFDKIYAAKEMFKRRFILIPVFVCAIMCPDQSLRKQVIKKLAQAVGSEPSWNKALEVANTLLQEELVSQNASIPRGYGSIKWTEVCDRLGRIALL